MVEHYIRIGYAVLTLFALVVFGIGYVVGRYGRRGLKQTQTVLVSCMCISIVVFVMPVLLSSKLPVTGPLIVRQMLLLSGEFIFALMGGCCSAILNKKWNRKNFFTFLLLPALMTFFCIISQVQNVQPVLDVVQQAGFLKPRDDYKPETNKTCPENLKGLYNAFVQYAELNDSLPPADKWEENTDFTSRVPQDTWLHCPLVSNGHDDKFGYAYNTALGGKKLNLNGKPLNSLPDAAKTPLLYDSTNLSKSAQDAVASLPKPGRHGGRNNILYLDGHVEAIAPK